MLLKALVYFTVLSSVATGIAGVEIGSLPNEQHQVSGTFEILDTRTIYIEDFNYDGLGPDAWFYYFPPGTPVSRFGSGGQYIYLPSEFGDSEGKLKRSRYTNVDVQVTLPSGVDACDIGTFIIWCVQFNAIFTRILIPRDVFDNDGADPCSIQATTVVVPPSPAFDNCIPFNDQLQVSWRVHDSYARFRLCGCQSTSTNQYMGFGLSGSDSMTEMVGADATIAWVDEEDGAQAVDYYLSAYTQCRAGVGACPDELDSSNGCTNDVFDIEGSITDGSQCVSFSKNFTTADTTCDQTIDLSNSDQYIVWAIGGLGETAFRHFLNANRSQSPIHLNRSSSDQCANVGLTCASCEPFTNKEMVEREDATFLMRIGPSGNERGYQGITGRAGWGVAFHVNDTLIPELVVERGKTYTFLIEGGDDSGDLSNYHPLYITNSIGGGRLENTQAERNAETVYAGFDSNGQPTAVGGLCQLSETAVSENTREGCNTLQAYLDTLVTPSSCATVQPGRLVWTPDEDTPDVVYYQCATHLNLGWRIKVLDENETYNGRDGSGAASVTVTLLLLLIVTFIALLFM